MNILAALRQAEAKLQKQADIVRRQLYAVRAASKILGRDVASGGKRIARKKRVMSVAARARISKAAKERGAKFRAEKKKGKGRFGEKSFARLDFCILRCQFCPFYKGLQDFSRRRIQSGVFKYPFLPTRKS